MTFIISFLLHQTQAIQCMNASPSAMMCPPPSECVLDQYYTINCTVFHSTVCDGPRFFNLSVPCRYCYQLNTSEITCDDATDCTPSIQPFSTKCYANSPCIGNSIFERRAVCKASSKSQKTAFLLSLFLGGFAADRFYLGYYVSASFKLVTLGGLGIVYMIDLFLILFGYLTPADGTLYPERLP